MIVYTSRLSAVIVVAHYQLQVFYAGVYYIGLICDHNLFMLFDVFLITYMLLNDSLIGYHFYYVSITTSVILY